MPAAQAVISFGVLLKDKYSFFMFRSFIQQSFNFVLEGS